jgi:hypothetical protein
VNQENGQLAATHTARHNAGSRVTPERAERRVAPVRHRGSSVPFGVALSRGSVPGEPAFGASMLLVVLAAILLPVQQPADESQSRRDVDRFRGLDSERPRRRSKHAHDDIGLVTVAVTAVVPAVTDSVSNWVDEALARWRGSPDR